VMDADGSGDVDFLEFCSYLGERERERTSYLVSFRLSFF